MRISSECSIVKALYNLHAEPTNFERVRELGNLLLYCECGRARCKLADALTASPTPAVDFKACYKGLCPLAHWTEEAFVLCPWNITPSRHEWHKQSPAAIMLKCVETLALIESLKGGGKPYEP